jgi:hypothetical protein
VKKDLRFNKLENFLVTDVPYPNGHRYTYRTNLCALQFSLGDLGVILGKYLQAKQLMQGGLFGNSLRHTLNSNFGFMMNRFMVWRRPYADPSTGETVGGLQKSQDKVQQIGTVGAMALVRILHIQFQ